MEMKLTRTLQAALALAAVLSLGSCSVLTYIFGSVFPATTMLAKAQADLSGMISSNDGGAFRVRIVESGSNAYVVVAGNPAGGSAAYFYDLDLHYKASFTAATGLGGNGVMKDANGNIALGNYLLNPVDLSQLALISATTLGSNTNAGDDGFADTTATVNYFGFSISGSTLNWASATGAWSSVTFPNAVVSVNSGLQLFAVLDDGNPSGSVYFVAGPSVNNGEVGTAYFFSRPKTSFTVTSNILDTSPSRGNLELGTFGFANGSIFAYDSSAASFVKINPADGSIQSSFYSATDPKDTRFAYRTGGGSFYGFDTKSRVLTKYGAWW